MIFGTNVGVPLSPPSLALVSQMLEPFVYFLAHSREDIPSDSSKYAKNSPPSRGCTVIAALL
jgi:hypothetical protein